MSSRIIAVLVLLALLAVPAMAQDAQAPSYSNAGQDKNSLLAGETVKVYALFSDNAGLAVAKLQTRSGDTYSDLQAAALSGTESWAIFKYAAPDVSSNTTVTWRIVANDTSGNTVVTPDTNFTIKFIPSCPAMCPGGIVPGYCSAWSDCTDGVQFKLCYICGQNTSYQCAQNVVNQTCGGPVVSPAGNETIEEGPTAADAVDAMDEAQAAIDAAKAEDRDTAAAEKLLASAQSLYDKDEYEAAIEKAGEAKSAALEAEVVEPEFPYMLALGIIIAIFGGVGVYLFQKSRKGKEVKRVVEEPEKVRKQQVCAICGKPVTYGYTCEECGKVVDFEHARTYKDKVYCTECLRKKGMM